MKTPKEPQVKLEFQELKWSVSPPGFGKSKYKFCLEKKKNKKHLSLSPWALLRLRRTVISSQLIHKEMYSITDISRNKYYRLIPPRNSDIGIVKE